MTFFNAVHSHEEKLPPPPFSETDEYSHSGPPEDQLPPYETPTYGDASGTSTRLAPATCKFPPSMNGYFPWKMGSSLFHLGPSANETLFAIGLHSGLSSGRPPMILYDGPSDKDPILATSKTEKHLLSRHLLINVNPSPRNPEGTSIRFNSNSRIFSMSIGGSGKDAAMEDFKWRRSHGSEIKDLAGNSWGWKLVRENSSATGTGGKRKERDPGFTSDGKEILAVIAYNMSASMSKATKFAFMGQGLTGSMGEDWEIAAVISGLWVWLIDTQILVSSC